MAEPRKMLRRAATLLAALAACAGIAFAVHLAQALPEGPEPIAWDREACAHCHMHVGEPRFAAQLQTQDGQVLDFDDPGCLLRYLGERKPAVHAAYFHHLREDRWIPLEKAAFIEAGPTPMGYGLGAVDVGTPGAMTLEQARERAERGHLAQKGQP